MRKFLVSIFESLHSRLFSYMQRAGMVLMCGGNAAPDTSGQNAAALKQAALSEEQLAWAKQIYAETAPDRAAATARAKLVSDAQLDSMQTQTNMAKDYDTYNKSTFRPLEQSIVADANAYDTPERREAMAAQAMADVGTQADLARETSMREAAARGVDPSSGNFAAMQGATDGRVAAAKAAAANGARTQVETIGAAKKMDAVNLGRGLSSNQATSAGLALTAGDRSAATGQAPLAIANTGAALMTSGYQGAQQGLAGASNSYGQIAGIQAKANENSAGMWGALGQVGGALATKLPMFAFSDVNAKENIEPVDPQQALEAVEKTPVSNWAYKQGVMPGENGQKHVGPMAQSVQKNMGDKVAPEGKKIDLVSMNGILMGAVQGLSRKVDQVIAMKGMTA